MWDGFFHKIPKFPICQKNNDSIPNNSSNVSCQKAQLKNPKYSILYTLRETNRLLHIKLQPTAHETLQLSVNSQQVTKGQPFHTWALQLHRPSQTFSWSISNSVPWTPHRWNREDLEAFHGRHFCDHQKVATRRAPTTSKRSKRKNRVHLGTGKRRASPIHGHVGISSQRWHL